MRVVNNWSTRLCLEVIKHGNGVPSICKSNRFFHVCMLWQSSNERKLAFVLICQIHELLSIFYDSCCRLEVYFLFFSISMQCSIPHSLSTILFKKKHVNWCRIILQGQEYLGHYLNSLFVKVRWNVNFLGWRIILSVQ